MSNKFLFLFLFFSLIFYTSVSFADNYNKKNQAKVRLLNKYTGKTELASLKTGEPYVFDKSLNILLRVCYKSSVQDEPENKAFIQVIRTVKNNSLNQNIKTLNIPKPADFNVKTKKDEVSKFIFSGWLFSSSPSVSYLQDKIYDITILKCY